MRGPLVAMIALAASCSFSGASGTDGLPGTDAGDRLVDGMTGIDAPDASPSFRKAITIEAGTVSERLVDFPVLVLFESDSDLRDRAREDGADIFFVGADGTTLLDFEIELWDSATGTLIAWVRQSLEIERATNTQGGQGRIGNAPGGSSGFGTNMGLNAIVDEVRIASTVRSPAWIAAEFANQSSPAGFYSVGAEESP